MTFTNLFGGGNGNEGLGILSLCLDFQYIGSSALYLPPMVSTAMPSTLRRLTATQTQLNTLLGYILNILLFTTIYYRNIWRARDFPFLSQLLFSTHSNGTSYQVFNQSAILDNHGVVDQAKLLSDGIPYMSATFASFVLTLNLGITATITHMMLYNWEDLKDAWSFMSPNRLRHVFQLECWKFWSTGVVQNNEEPFTQAQPATIDPHHGFMLQYSDTPDWWYIFVLIASVVVGIVCLHWADAGLSVWAFLIAIVLAAIMILFTGAQYGLTGFLCTIQPLVQLIGAYLTPGQPLTNMYFTLFGYNSVSQGLLLLQDLKLGQYAKLSPRCTFTMQMTGTFVGALLNYFIMVSITDTQRDVLLSIEGTNIWSGAVSGRFFLPYTWHGRSNAATEPTSFQHTEHHLGIGQRHVFDRQHISMGATGICYWLLCAAATLHCSSALSSPQA